MGAGIAKVVATRRKPMLDFCGKGNITADVEVIPTQKITRHTSEY